MKLCKEEGVIHLYKTSERLVTAPNFIEETTKAVKKIQAKIETTRSRHKYYADKRQRLLEFQVGDYVFLKKRGKLNPRFVGPYEILERVGKVAYKLALPLKLAKVHNVFHVSMLKKYVPNTSYVLHDELVEIHEDLCYEEKPIQVLDRKVKILQNKEISLVKVLWRNHLVEEATWKREDEIRVLYPKLF